MPFTGSIKYFLIGNVGRISFLLHKTTEDEKTLPSPPSIIASHRRSRGRLPMLRARKHKQSSLSPPFPCVRIWEHFTAASPHIFCAVVFPLLKEAEKEEGSSKMEICQERRRIFMLGRSPKEKYEQRKRQGRGQKNKRLSRKKRGGGGKINLGLLLFLGPPYCSSPSSRVKEEGENAKKQSRRISDRAQNIAFILRLRIFAPSSPLFRKSKDA